MRLSTIFALVFVFLAVFLKVGQSETGGNEELDDFLAKKDGNDEYNTDSKKYDFILWIMPDEYIV